MSARERIKASFRRIIDAEEAHAALCDKLAKEAGGVENLDSESQMFSDIGSVRNRPKFPTEITAVVSNGSWMNPPSLGMRKVGSFVSVRPCGEDYEGKTYLGIYLGDLPIGFNYTIDNESGVLAVAPGLGNPAIWTPALKRIVYGCESWWGPIKSPEDVDKMQITDDDIKNVWYVRMLKELCNGGDSKEAG